MKVIWDFIRNRIVIREISKRMGRDLEMFPISSDHCRFDPKLYILNRTIS